MPQISLGQAVPNMCRSPQPSHQYEDRRKRNGKDGMRSSIQPNPRWTEGTTSYEPIEKEQKEICLSIKDGLRMMKFCTSFNPLICMFVFNYDVCCFSIQNALCHSQNSLTTQMFSKPLPCSLAFPKLHVLKISNFPKYIRRYKIQRLLINRRKNWVNNL